MKRRPLDAAPDGAARDVGSAVTLTLPFAALSGLTVQAPPPALVSSDVGAEHVGLTRDGLREHLGWMARDPRWRSCVIVASQKRRFAAPADVIASMRDRYGWTEPSTASGAEDDAEAEVDQVLREISAERVPQRTKRAP